jgi:CHAD domain-containing protein
MLTTASAAGHMIATPDWFGRRPRPIESLCERYGNDNARGFAASGIASDLFSRTKHVHRCGSNWLEPLQAAAVLHGIGRNFGQTRHEAHGRNIVLGQGIAGFDGDMVNVIASAVFLHRGALLADPDVLLDSLPTDMTRPAKCVAAVLRIAVALVHVRGDLGYLDDTRTALRWHVSSEHAAEAATEAADLWDQVMPRPLTFRRECAGQHAARRSDGLQAAGYRMAQGLIQTIGRRRTNVVPGADIEELHQFRVASRRLRAVLRATRPAFGRPALAPLETAVRDMTRATNAVRDLDVMLEAFQGFSAPRRTPTLWRHMLADRQAREREMYEALDGKTYRRFEREAEAFLHERHPWACAASRPWARKRVHDAAPKLVQRGLDRVLSYREGVASGEDGPLHDLRLACKRLRYTAELLGVGVPGAKNRIVKPVQAMQESLGDWNDAQVHGAYVARYAAGLSRGEIDPAALRDIVELNANKQRRALHTFHAQWAAFVGDESRAAPLHHQ